MKCNKCKEIISIKDNVKDVTLLCGCELMFIRSDKSIKIIPKKQFKKDYKK